ncbi:MAG TPA: hypothetical protein DCY40_05465 [Actinobacteria bacterium]|nr:hypothetical protein [Actinomycetota bacterium]
MDDTARILRDRLVEAYTPYLDGVLAARDWPADAAAMRAGEDWLRDALDGLLALPYAEQQRTPLELFQEAMAAPNAALAAQDVAAPARDPVVAAALPGDVYDLAPASSAVIGEEVWRAHLEWGAAKAAAVTRPVVALLAANLLDRDRIERAMVARGYRLEPIRTPDRVRGHAVVLVDLTDAAAEATIAAAAGEGIRVIAFGPHVDEFAMVRARSLGATAAMARSQFFHDLEGLLPPFV